jgi:hypothetical protein
MANSFNSIYSFNSTSNTISDLSSDDTVSVSSLNSRTGSVAVDIIGKGSTRGEASLIGRLIVKLSLKMADFLCTLGWGSSALKVTRWALEKFPASAREVLRDGHVQTLQQIGFNRPLELLTKLSSLKKEADADIYLKKEDSSLIARHVLIDALERSQRGHREDPQFNFEGNVISDLLAQKEDFLAGEEELSKNFLEVVSTQIALSTATQLKDNGLKSEIYEKFIDLQQVTPETVTTVIDHFKKGGKTQLANLQTFEQNFSLMLLAREGCSPPSPEK